MDKFPVSTRASNIEYAIRDVVLPAMELERQGNSILKLNKMVLPELGLFYLLYLAIRPAYFDGIHLRQSSKPKMYNCRMLGGE